MAKPVSEAKALIDSLLAQGYKKSQIARKLGIDSSTISQIAGGKKPGRNLVEPLKAIERKEAVIPSREVRKTKSGEPARVRQSKKTAKPGLKRDSQGRLKNAPETQQAAAAVRRLEQIANAGGKVTLIVTYEDGGVRRVFERGGQYAQSLAADYHSSGQKFFEWLSDVVADQLSRQYGGASESLAVVGVAYLAIYGEAAVLR